MPHDDAPPPHPTDLDDADIIFDEAPAGLLTRRQGPHARALALAGTALLVVVVLIGLFARATSDPGSALTMLLRIPTPTPVETFVPGANVVFFNHGVPWGTLTVDGKPIPTSDMMGGSIAVSRGTHHLVYQARYFPSLRCDFSAPSAPSDTCPLGPIQTDSQMLATYPLARTLELGSTSDHLRDDQRIAIIQTIDALLAKETRTAAIAPGDRYVDGQGRIVTASEPLWLTLGFALGGGNNQNIGGGCLQLCPYENAGPGISFDGQWHTQVTISESWTITDASGQRLTALDYQPSRYAGYVNLGQLQTDVGIQLTPAGWQVNSLQGNELAMAINDAASQTLGQAMSGATVGDPNSGYGMTPLLGINPLDGCVMDVTIGAGATQPTMRLLWRFGMLVTVNVSARKAFPQLPVATTAEQSAATRIEAQASQMQAQGNG